MTWRTYIAMVAVAAFTLFSHGTSAASIIPPGNSAADQYTEAFPGATGNEQAGRIPNPNRKPSLPETTIKKFRSHGQVGNAALALATSTDPNRYSDSLEKAGKGEAKRRSRVTEDESSSDSGIPDKNLEVIKQATGMSGYGDMGYGLAITLFAVTIIAIGYAASRNRALG